MRRTAATARTSPSACRCHWPSVPSSGEAMFWVIATLVKLQPVRSFLFPTQPAFSTALLPFSAPPLLLLSSGRCQCASLCVFQAGQRCSKVTGPGGKHTGAAAAAMQVPDSSCCSSPESVSTAQGGGVIGRMSHQPTDTMLPLPAPPRRQMDCGTSVGSYASAHGRRARDWHPASFSACPCLFLPRVWPAATGGPESEF